MKQQKNDWLGFAASLWLPCAFLGLVLSWLAWGTWAPRIAQWSEGADQANSTVGTWGDSFGALNVLVGIAGFGALCLTLAFQRKALEEQRNDLHRQRFEATFFDLLRLFRECREDTVYTSVTEIDPETGGHKEFRGIDAFQEAETQIRAHIVQQSFYSEPKQQKEKAKLDLIKVYQEKIHDRSEKTISPYFRVIYGIIKRIHNDRILSYDEKLDYIRLLRGQIGS